MQEKKKKKAILNVSAQCPLVASIRKAEGLSGQSQTVLRFSMFLVSFCVAGDQTQGFTYGRQVHCHQDTLESLSKIETESWQDVYVAKDTSYQPEVEPSDTHSTKKEVTLTICPYARTRTHTHTI